MSEHELLTRKYLDSDEAREKFKIGHTYFDGSFSKDPTRVDKEINEHGIGIYRFSYKDAFLIIDNHLNIGESHPPMTVEGEDVRGIDNTYYKADMTYVIKDIRLSYGADIGNLEQFHKSVMMRFNYTATISVDTDERNNPEKVYDYAYLLSHNFRNVIYPTMERKGKLLDNNVVLTPKLVEYLGLSVDKFIFNSYTTPTTSSSDSYNECIYSMDNDNRLYIVGIDPEVYNVINNSDGEHLDKPLVKGIIEWDYKTEIKLLKINPKSYKDLGDYKDIGDLSNLSGRSISEILNISPNGSHPLNKGDAPSIRENDGSYQMIFSKSLAYKGLQFQWVIVYTIGKGARLSHRGASTLHLSASVHIKLTVPSNKVTNLWDYLNYYGRYPAFTVATEPNDDGYSLALIGVTICL